MICPKDGTQTIQHDEIGTGESYEDFYDTGTVQFCPKCEELYVEYYSVARFDSSHAEKSIRKTLKELFDEAHKANSKILKDS